MITLKGLIFTAEHAEFAEKSFLIKRIHELLPQSFHRRAHRDRRENRRNREDQREAMRR
jgi:hypothetical protein